MDNLKKSCLFCMMLLAVFFSLDQQIAAQVVETPASVGFTGTYVSPSAPDPGPSQIEEPSLSEEPHERPALPQTNSYTNHSLIWLGLGLVGLTCLGWRKNHQIKTLRK
jgi:hypothetical protein